MENLNLPEEYLNPLLSCFELLKNCNLIIFEERLFFRRVFKYFYIFTSVATFHVALTLYLVEGLRRGMDLDELVYVVPIYVVCSQTILKGVIVTCYKKELRLIILRLGGIWRTEGLSDEQIYKKNTLLKRLKFCYAAFYWMNIIGSWQYIIAPLLEVMFRRYILQQDCGFLFPFGCYIPFDPRESWAVYLPVYFFEVYSMFRIVYCYLGTEFLMITLCSHLATEFTMLQQDLLHLKPESEPIAHFNENLNEATNFDGFDREVELRSLIRRHQILIALAQDLDNIFNKMIFVNLSSASISICFFGFSAKVASDTVSLLNNFVAVIASMLPIYNLCYYAQLLMEASAGIADAAYGNIWYKGSQRYKIFICIIIMRSQKPSSLTSLKYNPIALSTFTTVMSTTWSYFSLASSLYGENVDNTNSGAT